MVRIFFLCAADTCHLPMATDLLLVTFCNECMLTNSVWDRSIDYQMYPRIWPNRITCKIFHFLNMILLLKNILLQQIFSY